MGDFNGDGFQDAAVVFGSAGSPVGVDILLNNRNGTLTAAQSLTECSIYNGSVAIGDVNADGALDLLSDGYLYLNNGRGGFGAASPLNIGFAPAIHGDTLIDLNHDGNLDYLTVNGNAGPGTGILGISIGNGNGTFQNAVTVFLAAATARPRDITAADFNGDGEIDLAIEDTNRYVVYTLQGNGDGSFMTPSETASDGWFVCEAGDLNHDGALDLLMDTGTLFGNTRELTSAARIDLNTAATARAALESLKLQLSRIEAGISSIGATQSRIDTVLSCLQSARINHSAASSQIGDADVAEESASLVRSRILQQAGIAVLTQSNQSPGISLQLLENL